MFVLRACFLTSLLLAGVTLPTQAKEPSAAVQALPRAHAHNDYWHERPLLDALDRGFCSVEADVSLVDGQLLVGHEKKELVKDRTLASLYLDPLRERVRARDGSVHAPDQEFFLLVDIKSDAEATYAALDELLAHYADLLTKIEAQKRHRGAVTIVVSGNRAEATIRAQQVRYAGIDGRPADLDKTEPAHVMPWISENWNSMFRWKGEGPMPTAERTKLREYVEKAHAQNRLVRFWATPENEAVWKELLAADVDLIGTDKLDMLQAFLVSSSAAR